MTTPLAIAFTPNYFVPVAVMLRSVLDSSAGKFEVLCLLTEEIPLRMQDKLSNMAGDRMTFRYSPLKGRLDGIYTDPRYTEAASLRLLLPELLPEYNRILYIDCDVIVRQDIGELYWQCELGGNLLAAVYEAAIEGQAERFRALGCNPEEYFNSGFLLMNLAKMRDECTSDKLLDACRVPYLEFPDQDALNIVCKGRVLPLSPLYNSIRTFFIPKYKSDFERQYGLGLWNEVQTKGTIHYTGGKPWKLFTVQFGQWWKVYETLPQEIKDEWTPDARVLRLWKFYKTALGRLTLDGIRAIKQKLA